MRMVTIKAARLALLMMRSGQEIFLPMAAEAKRVTAFQGNTGIGGKMEMVALKACIHRHRPMYIADLIGQAFMTAHA